MSFAARSLLALALVTTACSLDMNVAPADPSKRTHAAALKCTASPLAPLGDTLGAAVGAYAVGVSASASDKVLLFGQPVDKGVGLALGISELVVYGAAATYGYIQVARCNALRREQHLDHSPGAPASAQAAAPPAPPETAPGTADDHDATEARPAASGGVPQHELPAWSAFRRVPLPRAGTSTETYDRPVP